MLLASDGWLRAGLPGRHVLSRGISGLLTHSRRSGGQAMVEYALGLMIFLSLIIGVVDFGRAFVTHNLLANTAREGARYGTIPGRTEAEIISYASSKAGLPGITVTVENRGTPGSTTDPVVVSASSTFVPITPLIEQLCCSGGSLVLSARSSMLVER